MERKIVVGKDAKVLSQDEVGSKVNGSCLRGYLNGYGFKDLVAAFGRPTYLEPSGDEKVQMEWVIRFDIDGEYKYATIYDWKTYDREYTTTELTEWNIGGHENYIPYLVQGLLDYELNKR